MTTRATTTIATTRASRASRAPRWRRSPPSTPPRAPRHGPLVAFDFLLLAVQLAPTAPQFLTCDAVLRRAGAASLLRAGAPLLASNVLSSVAAAAPLAYRIAVGDRSLLAAPRSLAGRLLAVLPRSRSTAAPPSPPSASRSPPSARRRVAAGAVGVGAADATADLAARRRVRRAVVGAAALVAAPPRPSSGCGGCSRPHPHAERRSLVASVAAMEFFAPVAVAGLLGFPLPDPSAAAAFAFAASSRAPLADSFPVLWALSCASTASRGSPSRTRRGCGGSTRTCRRCRRRRGRVRLTRSPPASSRLAAQLRHAAPARRPLRQGAEVAAARRLRVGRAPPPPQARPPLSTPTASRAPRRPGEAAAAARARGRGASAGSSAAADAGAAEGGGGRPARKQSALEARIAAQAERLETVAPGASASPRRLPRHPAGRPPPARTRAALAAPRQVAIRFPASLPSTPAASSAASSAPSRPRS